MSTVWDYVLVPVEGSDRSMEGFRYALEHFPDADFTTLHAVSTGSGDLDALSRTGREPPEQGARRRGCRVRVSYST